MPPLSAARSDYCDPLETTISNAEMAIDFGDKTEALRVMPVPVVPAGVRRPVGDYSAGCQP